MSIAALFNDLALTGDSRADWCRNIVSLRRSQRLFDDLVDDERDQDIAAAAEMASKPPQYRDTPAIHRPFDEAQLTAEVLAAIHYPFRHVTESRYSDGRWGVWYGASDVETTVRETVYHWRRFLADAQDLHLPAEVVNERRVYRVRCTAALLDLRARVADYPDLLHPGDYSFCQQLGRRMHTERHPGLVTVSARGRGDVAAVFTPAVLDRPRDHCFLTYRYRPHEDTVRVIRGGKRAWLRLKGLPAR